ncbi:hypothetical protein ORV05_05065 [Amycolatopsis cynarae]|uniref:Glycerol kinase n=1 Tax=Amycolatopsis cynarae TaxID=2995223 RepID=A0ABY7B8V5_9PSEU|nr:hypothetical protein [Amycolatopsis sp. HUAS 11-8]WAL67163.1 hypothetical protein ORV05_05065 [Amycolatopsis sp. HUAS 11-8]
MDNVAQLKAALQQINDQVQALPTIVVGDGFMQGSASFCSLTQGMTHPAVIAAQHTFQEAANIGSGIIALASMMEEAVDNTIEVL